MCFYSLIDKGPLKLKDMIKGLEAVAFFSRVFSLVLEHRDRKLDLKTEGTLP